MYGGVDAYGRSLGPFPTGNIVFPRYSVGPPDEFPMAATVLERDFWHAAGRDFKDFLVIDFEKALREL